MRINAHVLAGSATAAATVRNKAGLYHALVAVLVVAARLVKTSTTTANCLLVQIVHGVMNITGSFYLQTGNVFSNTI